jgi:hypothetical protein
MQWLVDQTASATSLMLALLMLLAWQLGWLLGTRRRGRLGENPPDDATINEACLATLGLLLAFSFATAYSKYESRRSQVIHEANAIGTFAIRVQLLPPDVRQPVRQSLEHYVRLHLHITQEGVSRAERHALDRQIRATQDQIVAQVTAAMQTSSVFAIIIINSLNDMLDQYEIRVAGVVDRVPPAVIGLLVAASIIVATVMGRMQGENLKQRPVMTLLFILLVCCIVYVTLDLDQPWQGLSRTSELSMQRVAESLGVTP